MMERRIDVRGKLCPYPVVLTMREIRDMQNGDTLEVLTDNPPSVENVPAAAKREGHEVLNVIKTDSGWKISIKVKK
jgi:tRNA 2-thiouridine synthesizing protein A